MDTGGLAQMTYNSFSPTGLGVPGAGFASRGKGSGLKRLSVASPPSIAPINENGVETNHTPRTSRSHLLAGLRTQPKTPGMPPASAPYAQTQHRLGLDASKYSSPTNAYGHGMPHTAIGSSFPNNGQQYGMNAAGQVYALPEQVLAPPTIDYSDLQGDDVDPNVMSQLMATEFFLAQRQQQLQQQLFSLSAGLQGMNMNGNSARHTPQTPQTPMSAPGMSFYNQQLQNGVSPIPQEIPGQPGVYLVYNPMTGQYTCAVDPSVQQQSQLSNSPPPATPGSFTTKSVFNPETPTFQVSPPIESRNSNPFDTRSISPPKKSPSPPSDVNVTPLPPPSANAFRRGHHKKVSSLAFDNSSPAPSDGPKSAFTRPVGFPATPMTGTFGPGNARAGEHPVRQPRGPPPLEELVAAPTTKHEGSKNFSSRQRRRALNSLVKAGIERRVVGRQSSMDSTGRSLPTPGSETEIVFGVPSDGEESIASAGSGSGSLSGRPSFGSLKGAANAAIGSEMKAEKQRKASGDSSSSVEEFVREGRMRSPMGMLSGAVKRVY